MGGDDLAAARDALHVGGSRDLPGVRPHLVDLRVELGAAAHQDLEGHGGRNVRQPGKLPGVVDGKGADGRHDLGAVDQCEPLGRLEPNRRKAAGLQCLCPAHFSAVVEGLALAQEHQRQVSQGGQVPACAHGAFLRDDRNDAAVQELKQLLGGFQADARVPAGEILDPQRHDGPHRLRIQRAAHAGGVAHKDVLLQTPGVFPGDGDVAQGPEAGGDSVDAPLLPHPPVHERPAGSNARFGRGTQPGFRPVPRHRDKRLDRHAFHVQEYGLHPL